MLQVVIQKLAEQDSTKVTVLQHADQIMAALLRVFSCRQATVHEEAMLAVGALTYACGQQFSKYMQMFYPVLEMGLQQHLVSWPASKLPEPCFPAPKLQPPDQRAWNESQPCLEVGKGACSRAGLGGHSGGVCN